MKLESKFVDEVAYFRSKGAELVDLHSEQQPSARPTVIFVLDVPATLEVATERKKFLNRSCSVEPRLFSEMMRNTTDLLFEELRKKGKYNGKK